MEVTGTTMGAGAGAGMLGAEMEVMGTTEGALDSSTWGSRLSRPALIAEIVGATKSLDIVLPSAFQRGF
jgi:hypothetical protein